MKRSSRSVVRNCQGKRVGKGWTLPCLGINPKFLPTARTGASARDWHSQGMEHRPLGFTF